MQVGRHGRASEPRTPTSGTGHGSPSRFHPDPGQDDAVNGRSCCPGWSRSRRPRMRYREGVPALDSHPPPLSPPPGHWAPSWIECFGLATTLRSRDAQGAELAGGMDLAGSVASHVSAVRQQQELFDIGAMAGWRVLATGQILSARSVAIQGNPYKPTAGITRCYRPSQRRSQMSTTTCPVGLPTPSGEYYTCGKPCTTVKPTTGRNKGKTLLVCAAGHTTTLD